MNLVLCFFPLFLQNKAKQKQATANKKSTENAKTKSTTKITPGGNNKAKANKIETAKSKKRKILSSDEEDDDEINDVKKKDDQRRKSEIEERLKGTGDLRDEKEPPEIKNNSVVDKNKVDRLSDKKSKEKSKSISEDTAKRKETKPKSEGGGGVSILNTWTLVSQMQSKSIFGTFVITLLHYQKCGKKYHNSIFCVQYTCFLILEYSFSFILL